MKKILLLWMFLGIILGNQFKSWSCSVINGGSIGYNPIPNFEEYLTNSSPEEKKENMTVSSIYNELLKYGIDNFNYDKGVTVYKVDIQEEVSKILDPNLFIIDVNLILKFFSLHLIFFN